MSLGVFCRGKEGNIISIITTTATLHTHWLVKEGEKVILLSFWRVGVQPETDPHILYLCKNLFLAFIRHVYHIQQDILAMLRWEEGG